MTTFSRPRHTALGDKLLQHVVATSHSDKSLRVHWRIFAKVFVSATSRTESNHIEFIQLFAVTKFCFEDKDFHKNSPVQTRRLSLQRISVDCSNLSPDLYTQSDLSPRNVAATCRLVCTEPLKADY